MARASLLLKVGIIVSAVLAGGLAYATVSDESGEQYCRTKAGYIRISTTGECRRYETPIDLPTADDYNALIDRISALEAGSTQPQGSSEQLQADVADLLRRLPTASEHDGLLTLSKVDFSDRDLSGMNLSGANLANANLLRTAFRGTHLSGANLSGANLLLATLFEANLSGANFSGADLTTANLRFANISGANLSGAHLTSASLAHADLSGANLSGAELHAAVLSNVNVSGANFTSADLTAVVSSGIVGVPAALPRGWQIIDGVLVSPAATPFNEAVALPLTNGKQGALTVYSPEFFSADSQAFPELGRFKDDRAMKFTVTVDNVSDSDMDLADLRIVATTSSLKAPQCRTLTGDDGQTALLGLVDPQTRQPYSMLAAGATATFPWAVVCQAARGDTLSIEVSNGGASSVAFATKVL